MKSFFLKIKTIFTVLLDHAIRLTRNINIFKRMILISLIIIFIPNILIGYFAISKSSSEIEATISNYSYKSLYDLDRSISERLRKYSDLSYRIYLDSELQELLRKCRSSDEVASLNTSQIKEYEQYKNRIGNILYNMSSTLQSILNIEIISDRDEFTEINSLGKKAGARFADPDAFRNSAYYSKSLEYFNLPVWYDTSKNNSMFIMQNTPSWHMGNYITVLRSIPIQGKEGHLGIIVINISMSILSDVLTYDDLILQKGNLLLLGDAGIMYYFYMANRFPAFALPTRDALEDILKLNKSNTIIEISGKEYLVSAIKSDFTGWTLCSLFPRSSLLHNVYRLRNLIIFICVLCVLFAFIMSYIITISISRPIKNLKNTMGKVDEKNIEIEYIDDIGDEVGILGKKFNSMIKKIQNLISTVYEAELLKKEEIIKRREAELDALQMQINPHFLYNTLDFIRWQVISAENGEGKASRMILAFSKLLQLGTKRSANLVRLREEIEHVNAYIDVIRFDIEYKLNVRYIVEDDALLESKIPKLTLQPLIENAVVHGFQHTNLEGEIVIGVYRKNEDLLIEVWDNGEGLSEDTTGTINCHLNLNNRESKSLGLTNVNERIRLNFGELYGLKLESKKNEYTAVIIHIPFIV